jgi:hypothetical protein
MSGHEEAIRRLAYALWERAGCPDGRSDEFWHAARREMDSDAADRQCVDPFEAPIDEPPELAFPYGVPVGSPAERIAEQGVEGDGLAGSAVDSRGRSDD